MRLIDLKLAVVALLAGVVWQAASAADADACRRFKWDVARELAVMQETPQALVAGVKPGTDIPQLAVGTLYVLKLADQSLVTFAAAPAKRNVAPAVHAGIAGFRVARAGRYRVSVTSGHWIDVLDGVQIVPSVDFQGHVGCKRPSKIVEFDLAARRDLTLQFSGSSDEEVIVAITMVAAPATG